MASVCGMKTTPYVTVSAAIHFSRSKSPISLFTIPISLFMNTDRTVHLRTISLFTVTRSWCSRSREIHSRPSRVTLAMDLSDTVFVEYNASDRAGGSGGAEATLEGTLHVEGSRFSFRCQHQAETPREPTPERCFEYLATASLNPTR